MSPVIEGCAITLRNKNLMHKVIQNNSRVNASVELSSFMPHQISVQLHGLKPFEHYDYSAIPLMKDKRYTKETKGTVFALRKGGKLIV